MFVQVTKNTCQLRWRAPETDGGSAVTNYVICVRKRDAGSEEWKEEFAPWETDVKICEHVLTDLVPVNFEYQFRYMFLQI